MIRVVDVGVCLQAQVSVWDVHDCEHADKSMQCSELEHARARE